MGETSLGCVAFADPRRCDDLAREAWSRLVDAFNEVDARPMLRKAGLMLISPDGVASHVGVRVLGLLEPMGLRIAWAGVCRVGRDRAEALWRYDSPRFTQDRWELILQLMESGFSVVLFVVHTDPRVDASAVLADIKGPSDPLVAPPDSIRAVAGGQNKILNMIHTSDDHGSVLRESFILLGPIAFVAAWNSVAKQTLHPDLSHSLAKAAFARVLGDHWWCGVSLFHVALTTQMRALLSSASLVPELQRPDLIRTIESCLSVGRRAPASDAGRAQALFQDREWVAATDLMRRLGVEPLSRLGCALGLLAERRVSRCIDEVLRDMGVELDQMEGLVLSTSAALAGL